MTEEEFIQKYCRSFNEQQIEAVRTVNGPVLLLAVPGSGKTTVLVARLGYMVHVAGIDPSSILVMTYTVAATKEMKERFAKLYGRDYADQIEFRTINGLCAGIVYHYAKTISHNEPFALIQDDEVNRLVASIYFKVSREYATDNILKSIRTSITYVKNMMLSDEDIARLPTDAEHFDEIYHMYLASMQKNRWMDYDDQMCFAYLFLTKRPQLLKEYQDRFSYICVDEAQDTSRIQHEIIHLLGEKSRNIFMVGDEDQSIYGFRAAYPAALMHFKEQWKGGKVLLLERNYRSTEFITDAADAFVAKNKSRYKKHIHAARTAGRPVHVIEAMNREAQYAWLACEAANCKRETAVLFRNNDSAVALIDLLERMHVPYRTKQMDALFFTSRIVSDIRDIVTFSYEPDNADVFLRIYYKLSLQMSKENAQKIAAVSKEKHRDILSCAAYIKNLPAWLSTQCKALQHNLGKLRKAGGKRMLDIIWNDMHYNDYVEEHHLDENKLAVLEMIASRAKDPESLLKRLDELNALIRNHDNDPDCLFILSTIHSSKGLEYDRVFLMDVQDGILPAVTSRKDEKQYEEERRLYYVAMTRAKNDLYIFDVKNMKSSFNEEVIRSHPYEIIQPDDVFADLKKDLTGKYYYRSDGRKGKIIAANEEDILLEYDKMHIEKSSLADMLANRAHVYQKKEPLQNRNKFHKGAWITHIAFGTGQIAKVKHGNATIRFQEAGVKKINLQYAIEQRIIRYLSDEDGVVEDS